MDKSQQYTGKYLLSLLKYGDFAHVGEEEAILLVMNKFLRDDNQLILSVGCGLGGTPNFMRNDGWGKVIGIDIEPEAIEYAKTHHHGIDFHNCNVVHVDELFTIALFDIVTIFNVYYALYEPRHALQALHKVTKQGGQIAIMDYLDLCENQLNPLFQEGNSKSRPFCPIKKDEIKSLLSMTGWIDPEIVDISDKYIEWYQKLCTKLVADKEEIIKKFGLQSYEQYYDTYHDIIDAMQKKLLGGAIVYATKK